MLYNYDYTRIHSIIVVSIITNNLVNLKSLKFSYYHILYSTISVFYALNNDPEGEEEALAKMSQIEAPTQLIWGKHDQVKQFLFNLFYFLA